MIELTQQEIIDRFDPQSKCRISYMGEKTKIFRRLWQVDWKKCMALTILFDKPKSYLVDGDEAIRDGVRIAVKRILGNNMNLDDFTIPCVGNITTGDVILFEESVSRGKHTKYLGNRTVVAEVVKDHYDKKQQHIFTLRILHCVGTEPLKKHSTEIRRASLIYKRGIMRKPWDDESVRPISYDTKVGVKIVDPKRMKKYR